nr:MAG TPA: hypothetical protein [Caudoviricetes sp.]
MVIYGCKKIYQYNNRQTTIGSSPSTIPIDTVLEVHTNFWEYRLWRFGKKLPT